MKPLPPVTTTLGIAPRYSYTLTRLVSARSFHSDLVQAWRSAWHSARFRARALATPVVLLLVLRFYSYVLHIVEARPGPILPDAFLERIPPHDLSWLIFSTVYGVMGTGLIRLLWFPRELVRGVLAYVILTAFRIVALWVTPLDPPAGMIVLRDALTEGMSGAGVLTRDLFFSGHTATVFLFSLGVPGRAVQRAYLAGTILVGVAVLVQHVHYTVDVVAAPFFAYASLGAASWLCRGD
jgi:hypothetical protein